MNALAFGLVMLAFVALAVGIIIIVTRKHKGSKCTPMNAENSEGVLEFVYNDSGNCVANSCIEGYTLDSGICSKAAEAPATAPAAAPAKAQTNSCLEEYDPSKTYPVVDDKADNYGNYCLHATRAECKQAFCSNETFKNKCAIPCAT